MAEKNPYKVALGVTFATKDAYDKLRADLNEALDGLALLGTGIAHRELRDRVVLTPLELEAVLEKHGLTPTGEVAEAFRLGVAWGREEKCACGDACACKS
jgi:hypothetical protein